MNKMEIIVGILLVMFGVIVGLNLNQKNVEVKVDVTPLVNKIDECEVVSKEWETVYKELQEQDSKDWEIIRKYVNGLDKEQLKKWHAIWK